MWSTFRDEAGESRLRSAPPGSLDNRLQVTGQPEKTKDKRYYYKFVTSLVQTDYSVDAAVADMLISSPSVRNHSIVIRKSLTLRRHR